MIETLTPRKIVEYLDQYIIGQKEAKKSVAIALRNRWRSSRLSQEMKKRSKSEKYSPYRADRCRKNRNSKTIGITYKSTFL